MHSFVPTNLGRAWGRRPPIGSDEDLGWTDSNLLFGFVFWRERSGGFERGEKRHVVFEEMVWKVDFLIEKFQFV